MYIELRMSENTIFAIGLKIYELTRIMQTLFKNLFNLMNLLGISLFVILTKIFQKPLVKGTLRYQKINFFTTSALSQLHYLG